MTAALRLPALLVWLTLLWIALWGELTWANLLGGLAVAIGILLFARLDRRFLGTTYFRPLWAVWYVLVVLWNLVLSNLRLAREIITPGLSTYTSIIAVPMRGGSDSVINLVANSITLTPGTMTVDVKTEGDLDHDGAIDGVVLYVHGMYTRDIEAVRHEILQLEALALRAFGSPDDYQRARLDVISHEEAMTSSEQLQHLRTRHADGPAVSGSDGAASDGSRDEGRSSDGSGDEGSGS